MISQNELLCTIIMSKTPLFIYTWSFNMLLVYSLMRKDLFSQLWASARFQMDFLSQVKCLSECWLYDSLNICKFLHKTYLYITYTTISSFTFVLSFYQLAFCFFASIMWKRIFITDDLKQSIKWKLFKQSIIFWCLQKNMELKDIFSTNISKFAVFLRLGFI